MSIRTCRQLPEKQLAWVVLTTTGWLEPYQEQSSLLALILNWGTWMILEQMMLHWRGLKNMYSAFPSHMLAAGVTPSAAGIPAELEVEKICSTVSL